MDPLGMLWEGLLSHFDPSFLTFALVLGYLWFFLFFFRTKHWDYLEWPERFFFGFMIGFVALIAFIMIDFPIMILLTAFYAEHLILNLMYMTPVLFSVFLLGVRVHLAVPLSSEKAKDQILSFLTKHKSYWLYLMMIFSMATYLGFGYGNSFLGASSRLLLGGFLLIVSFSLFYSVLIISFLVTLLSCLPFKYSRLRAIVRVLEFVFPFLRVHRIDLVREIDQNQQLRKGLFKRGLSLLRNDFVHKAILVALLSVALVLADSSFHIATPIIQIIEIEYETNEIEVFRDYSNPIVYYVEVTRTYRIRLPTFNIRNLNLSIPNPSNFSVLDGSKSIFWWKKPYAINVEADSSLAYTLITNQKGEVESINVMPTKVAQGNWSNMRLTYNDRLDVDLIKVGEARERNLENGSVLVTISLIANNTQPRQLHSSDFPLFPVERYGNLTSFEVFENGIKKPSPWNIIENQWLWVYVGVKPNTFLNLTASAIFEETTT